MNETDNKLSTIVEEVVEWKKNADKDWEYISSHLYFLDAVASWMEKDKSSFEYYIPYIIQKAKAQIERDSPGVGIGVRKERWFFLDSMRRQVYWHNFTSMMSSWDEERLKTVSDQSVDIVNCLSNPSKTDTPASIATRKGLVYGNVQSGKTAHIAAMIAMYASSGCPLIIVLSGVTKSLRLQTQNRLRHDLGIDKYGNYDLMTPETDLLGKKEVSIEGKLNSNRPCIGVFKKSPAALKRLLAYLRRTNDPCFWNGRQVLIVDDECDQYSVNVKQIPDEDDGNKPFERSTINRLIVDLFHTFERYCYVGFTATPFANLLNEQPGDDSIYPRDFIYPLEISPKYFGADKLFGSISDDPEEDTPVADSIVYVKEEQISPKFNSFRDIPDSLIDAILYFIVATACRYYRNQFDHSSMLIHLDQRIATHNSLKMCIEKFLQSDSFQYHHLEKKMKEIWDKEKPRNPFSLIQQLFHYDDSYKDSFEKPEFEKLSPFIRRVISEVKVVVDNSSIPMEERLHYHDDHPDVYIVIGGNTLSRGITLYGLMVSVFYRTTKIYDTLLQMGRWFGFKLEYEDLPRLFTTEKLVEEYSKLATVEEKIREEFSNYEFDISPEDVAPKIIKMPELAITRKMAMQSAISTGINYSGSRPQTLFFPAKNGQFHKNNQKTTKAFLDSIENKRSEKNKMPFYESVPISCIQDFIEKFSIIPENRTCDKNMLLKFLSKANDRGYLQLWNVCVVTTNTGKEFNISSYLSIHLIERSRYDRHDPEEETLYIKALQQPNNMFLDTEILDKIPKNINTSQKFSIRHNYFKDRGEEEPGLLLIYPINKDSKYTGKYSNRVDLEAPDHIIGLTFVFPNNKDILLDEYMQIDLPNRSDVDEET